MFRLTKETPDDEYEVEYLFDLAFAPGREALSSYRLREGVPPVGDLCTIARDDYDVLAGAIRFWPVTVGDGGHAALLLGPIAVHPTRQGEGLGGLIMTHSLEAARHAGWDRVILVGDAPYYSRFGFERGLATGISFPPPTNPDRLLAQALRPGAFEGVTGAVRKWQPKTSGG